MYICKYIYIYKHIYTYICIYICIDIYMRICTLLYRFLIRIRFAVDCPFTGLVQGQSTANFVVFFFFCKSL